MIAKTGYDRGVSNQRLLLFSRDFFNRYSRTEKLFYFRRTKNMTKLDIAGYILTGICGVITAAYGVWIAAYAVTEYIDNK